MGGSATIQRGRAEAIQTKKDQRGENPRQYRKERHRLYNRGSLGGGPATIQRGRAEAIKEKGIRDGRICDNTERTGRDYTEQRRSKGATVEIGKTWAIQNKGNKTGNGPQ